MKGKVLVRGLVRGPADLILINCPMRDYGVRAKDHYEVLPPIGLGIIATFAQRAGFNVGMIDAESEGLSINQIIETINLLKPEFVGINILTPTRMVALEIAKCLDPNITLLIGGAHATAMPEKTIREFSGAHEKTLLFVSEAEVAVSHILRGDTKEAVPGVCWVDKGTYQFTCGSLQINDLNLVPPINRIFFANDPAVDINTGWIEARILGSRGCPFTCTYCSGSRTTLGTKVRKTSGKLIALEIAQLQKEYGIESIRFIDDLMIISERRVREIMDALDKLGVSIKWDATGRADAMSKFSPKFYDYMVAHGLHEVAIGVESGSDRMRIIINKQVTEQEVWNTVEALVSRGIKVKCYLIVGLPDETVEETAQTFDLAKRLMEYGEGLVRASIFLFRPYPGTEEWNKLIASGWSEDQLLKMGATGTGVRAKHTVVTNHQYAELSPTVLIRMISEHNANQLRYIQSKE